ncbi:MAG: single-stranded DNA-binding protein [Acidimicrobiales bacterium]
MNAIHFVGNLTADPKLIEGASGKVRVSCSVAVNEGQGDDEKTHFVNVSAFGTLAENIAHSLTKGQRVVVVGRLNTYKREVEVDDQPVNLTMVSFTASAMGPDLRFARAKVSKVVRNLEPDEGNVEADEAPAASSKPSAASSKASAKKVVPAESDDF